MAGFTAGQYLKATDADHADTDGVKRYVALLTQLGTDAPVATVLENSFGATLVWTRNDEGQYDATLAGAFTANKTSALISNGATATAIAARRNDSNDVVRVVTTEGSMDAATIEIRVYP